MEHPKFIEFKGKKYRLSAGNYYRTENWSKDETCNLHRAIWEDFYGCSVPPGHDVHHIDHNPFNNDIGNLQLIHDRDHARLHLKKRITEGTLDNEASLAVAREEAKKWHQSEEGREWHRKNGKDAWKDRKYYKVNCKYCGKELVTPFPSRKKFCGINCQTRFRYNSRKDDVERNCIICGAVFKANKYSKIKTCSKDCWREAIKRSKARV